MKGSPAYSLDKAIVTSDSLYIAREDYRISEDVALSDGTIFKKGKRFFTISELFLLREAGAFPEGWDIPNGCELIDITREFGTKNSNRHPHHLMTSLGLELGGTPMGGANYDRYNSDPMHCDHCIIGRNIAGYYLGASVDGINTCMLFISDCEDGFYVAPCKNSAIGQVRLVFRGFQN